MYKTYRNLLNLLNQLTDEQLNQPIICKSEKNSEALFPTKDENVFSIDIYPTSFFVEQTFFPYNTKEQVNELFKTDTVVVLQVD